MNLLITGAWNGATEYISRISEMGHNVCFLKDESEKPDVQDDWVEGIICNSFFLHHDIDKFNNLKYIQLTSAGYDRVPMKTVLKRGIKIYNAGGVYSIPIAESVILGVLCLYKRAYRIFENKSKCLWEKQRDLQELYGKSVLMIGCGSIAGECAKRFGAFGAEVIGVDIAPRKDKNYKKIYDIGFIDDALKTADIVIMTIPLTDKTYHIMDKKRFLFIKPGAVFVNVSRGAVVDTDALVGAMNTLGGAVLDVFEEEPLKSDSPLWNFENAIITPHNSFVGENNNERLSRLIMNNLSGGNN